MSEGIEQKFKEALNVFLSANQWEEACEFFFQYYPKIPKTWEIVLIGQAFKVYQQEKLEEQSHLFFICKSVEDAVFHYTNVKFLLRRFEYDLPADLQEEFFTYIKTYSVSKTFLRMVAEASVIHLEKVKELL